MIFLFSTGLALLKGCIALCSTGVQDEKRNLLGIALTSGSFFRHLYSTLGRKALGMLAKGAVLNRTHEWSKKRSVLFSSRYLASLCSVTHSKFAWTSGPSSDRLLRTSQLAYRPIGAAPYSKEVKMRMATFDELPIPKFNYRECYANENRKFNAILFSGVAILGSSLLFFYYTDCFDIDAMLAPKSYRYRKVYRDPSESGGLFSKAWFQKSTQTEKVPVTTAVLSSGAPVDQTEESFTEKTAVHPKPVSWNLPEHVPYLLIGAGTASAAAAKAIQENDPDAKILIVGDDRYYPYKRPPLSKVLLWSSDDQLKSQLRFTTAGGKVATIFHRPETGYCRTVDLEQKTGIAVAFGRRILKLDVDAHEAILDDNSRIKYNKCLIATGAKPRIMPQIRNMEDDAQKYFTVFRDVADFLRLAEVSRHAKCITVVGGGLLGTELACALQAHCASNETKVVHVFPQAGCLSRLLPSYLSDWSVEHMRKLGIDVRPNTTVANAEEYSIEETSITRLVLSLDNGDKVKTDHVVMAIGVEPNVEIAKDSGLPLDETNGGIICDVELSCAPDVYAAGDCCSYYDFKQGHKRVEHHSHAERSGALAGNNMSGARKAYSYLRQFRSGLGPSLTFVSVGEVDSALPTVGYFKGYKGGREGISVPGGPNQLFKPGSPADLSKGVVFYLRDQHIVGVLLWNLPQSVPTARSLLTSEKRLNEPNEAVKLFEL
uniref:FAD/NAD(P)-binding domain-containing protein n=1 Tax=Trichuris muris TaxID=70415 RepID=A0A5S6QR04_TRIMR